SRLLEDAAASGQRRARKIVEGEADDRLAELRCQRMRLDVARQPHLRTDELMGNYVDEAHATASIRSASQARRSSTTSISAKSGCSGRTNKPVPSPWASSSKPS